MRGQRRTLCTHAGAVGCWALAYSCTQVSSSFPPAVNKHASPCTHGCSASSERRVLLVVYVLLPVAAGVRSSTELTSVLSSWLLLSSKGGTESFAAPWLVRAEGTVGTCLRQGLEAAGWGGRLAQLAEWRGGRRAAGKAWGMHPGRPGRRKGPPGKHSDWAALTCTCACGRQRTSGRPSSE